MGLGMTVVMPWMNKVAAGRNYISQAGFSARCQGQKDLGLASQQLAQDLQICAHRLAQIAVFLITRCAV